MHWEKMTWHSKLKIELWNAVQNKQSEWKTPLHSHLFTSQKEYNTFTKARVLRGRIKSNHNKKLLHRVIMCRLSWSHTMSSHRKVIQQQVWPTKTLCQVVSDWSKDIIHMTQGTKTRVSEKHNKHMRMSAYTWTCQSKSLLKQYSCSPTPCHCHQTLQGFHYNL